MDSIYQLNDFVEYLKKRIKKELPGEPVQKKMAPVLNGNIFRSMKPEKTPKSNAVLILLYQNTASEIEILFTLRSEKLYNHKGQISFPGGHAERGEIPSETALREAKEEIGLNPFSVRIIGKLSDLYVPPSESVITPVIAYTEAMPSLKINEDEVEEILSVRLDDFIDKNILKREKWLIQDVEVEVPLWDVHPKTPLWGATAMILAELLELYIEFRVIQQKISNHVSCYAKLQNHHSINAIETEPLNGKIE